MAKKSSSTIVPRGIRNNNPLNIRIGNTWLGEVARPTDSDFEQFVAPVYGLRAAFCILRRYIRRYGKNTPEAIIRTWAPSSENDTEKYITVVCHRAQLQRDQYIDFFDKVTMCKLVKAMAFVETGSILDDQLIEKGYDLS